MNTCNYDFTKVPLSINQEEIKDKYEFHKEIGRGREGIIYEVIDRTNNTSVALKVITIYKQTIQEIYYGCILSQLNTDNFIPVFNWWLCEQLPQEYSLPYNSLRYLCFTMPLA